jgi:hypothetical protein
VQNVVFMGAGCAGLRHAGVVEPLTDRHAGEQPRDQILVGRAEFGQEADLLTRDTEEGLGFEVDPVTKDDVDVEALLGDVHGQVAAGIPGTDDQDSSAFPCDPGRCASS